MSYVNSQHPRLRTIVVADACTIEGESVALALAQRGEFKVRALSGSFTQSTSLRFAFYNIEMIQTDFVNVEELEIDLMDADALFIGFDQNLHDDFKDIAQASSVLKAETLLTACRRTGIRFIVCLTSPSPLQTLGWTARHLDSRVEVEMRVRKLPIRSAFLTLPLAYEVFAGFLLPRGLGRDTYAVEFPVNNLSVDAMSLEDVGEVSRSLFLQPEKAAGKTFGLTAQKLSCVDVVATFNKCFAPKRFVEKEVSYHEFCQRGSPGYADWAHAFQCYATNDVPRSQSITMTLNPEMQSFDRWLLENRRELENHLTSL